MKRRLEIARGLLNRPKVLFLDEPTVGLDTQTRRHILDYVKQICQKYKISVLVTTHYIEEADYLCNRVAIIDKGKIVACDTPERLKKKLEDDAVIAELGNAKDAERLAGIMKKYKVVKSSKIDGNRVHLYVKDAASALPGILGNASKYGIKVINVEMHKPSLEDVFIHYTGKEIREEEAGANDRMMSVIRSRNRR